MARTGHGVQEGTAGLFTMVLPVGDLCQALHPFPSNSQYDLLPFDTAEHRVLGMTPLLYENSQFRVNSSTRRLGVIDFYSQSTHCIDLSASLTMSINFC